MTNKTKELVAAGHALAKELHCAESAALVRELATQLDVQLARSNALAAENVGLREYRPQPSGAAMMEALDAFYEYHEDMPEQGMMAAFEILCCKRPATPTTNAWLAEVQASGVEMFSASLSVVGGHEHPYSELANDFAAQLRKGVQS